MSFKFHVIVVLACMVPVTPVWAQRESLAKEWRSCLLPPGFTLTQSLQFKTCDGFVVIESSVNVEAKAFRQWLDDRSKKNPLDLTYFRELVANTPKVHPEFKSIRETLLRRIDKELQHNPFQLELALLGIITQGELGNIEAADQQLQKFIAKYPTFLPAECLYCLRQHAAGKHQESIIAAQQLTKSQPHSVQAWMTLSDIYLLEWQRLAHQLFPDLNVQHPCFTDISVHLKKKYAESDQSADKQNEIKKTYAQLHTLMDQSKEAIEHAIPLLPKSGNEKQQGEVSKVLPSLECEPGLPFDVYFKWMNSQLIKSAMNGKPSSNYLSLMVNVFDKGGLVELADKNPDHLILSYAAYWFHSVRLTVSLCGTPEGAMVMQCKESGERQELFDKHYGTFWKQLEGLGNRLEDTFQHNPGLSAVLHYQRAFNYVIGPDNNEEARKLFAKSLQCEPSCTRSLIGYLGCYRIANQVIQWEDMPAEVQQAHDNAEGRTLFARNLMLTESGKVSDALRHLNKALELDPHYFLASLMKAGILVYQDTSDASLERAAQLWKQGYDLAVKAEKLSELAADYYLIMAAIEVLRGNPNKARHYVDIALDKEPTNHDAREALQRLDNGNSKAPRSE